MKTLLSACVILFAFGPTTIMADAAASTTALIESPTNDLMTTIAADSTKGRPLKATLTGDAEVPGPGDQDGTGNAEVTLNLGQQEVCYELSVENIAEATAAHIHSGAAGDSGPPVITLDAPASGSSSGCVSDVAKDMIQAILKSPADYYVNVHNADYPAGAVRGQLTKEAVGQGSE